MTNLIGREVLVHKMPHGGSEWRGCFLNKVCEIVACGHSDYGTMYMTIMNDQGMLAHGITSGMVTVQPFVQRKVGG